MLYPSMQSIPYKSIVEKDSRAVISANLFYIVPMEKLH